MKGAFRWPRFVQIAALNVTKIGKTAVMGTGVLSAMVYDVEWRIVESKYFSESDFRISGISFYHLKQYPYRA